VNGDGIVGVAKKSTLKGSIGTVEDVGIPQAVDAAVVGSGAAGLMSALSAAVAGATVLLIESEPVVGGTTAISGGTTWVPNHGFGASILKVADSAEAARAYLLGEGRELLLDHDLVDSFIENSPTMARFVETHTYLRWLPGIYPDYHSEIDGARYTRSLFPGPFVPSLLGAAESKVRPPKKSGMSKNPLPFWLLSRMRGIWIAGRALVGALLEGCLRYGVEVRTETRAVRLMTDNGEVTGLVVQSGGREYEVRTAKGVVIASGGFEGSDELTKEHLGAEFALQVTPRGHDGVAVELAESVNASLGLMNNAWWMPGMQIPGEEMDGRPISRLVLGERALPHTIMVNRAAQRFADEAISYNVIGRIMRQIDPETGEMPNASTWMIFDDFYRRHYGFFGSPPGSELGDFIMRANTVQELARKCGLDEKTLEATISEFNAGAAFGRDPKFHRGEALYERFFGDYQPRLKRLSPDALFPAKTARARVLLARLVGPFAGPVLSWLVRGRKPESLRSLLVPVLAFTMKPCLKNPAKSALAPIDTPPYFAVKVEASAIGTLGGPRTDTQGRVIGADGAVIRGLYAAGNAAAGPTNGFYGGAGGTITLGLTFGYLAGQELAR